MNTNPITENFENDSILLLDEQSISLVKKVIDHNVRSYYCNIPDSSAKGRWFILTGSKISLNPTKSFQYEKAYTRARKNRHLALEGCEDGVLMTDFEVPKGTESQCLSIIRGTPSSTKHAHKCIFELSERNKKSLLISRRNMLQRSKKNDILDDLEQNKVELTDLNETDRDTITKSRIGQGLYRKRLIAYWGSCSVTGLSNLPLLKASHVKPWRTSSNEERLDPMNGLLLQPTLDHLFDSGFISFSHEGLIIFSDRLSLIDIKSLNLSKEWHLRSTPDELMGFMAHHRKHVFK